MVEGRNEARGECPACGMPIPLAQTISRRDKSFLCKGCGQSLTIAKLGMVKAVLIVAAGLLLAKAIGFFGLIIALVVIGIGDWKLALTRLTDRSGER